MNDCPKKPVKSFFPKTEGKLKENGKCFPNCDSKVWMRSCDQEIIEPISGTIRGVIPKWLNGCLLRNGPGNLRFGNMQYSHLFDSSALLHRFSIKDGNVTYQCQFVQTDTFKRNKAAQRIVFSEFGTVGVPDPCISIFQRITAVFRTNEMTDNTMISIYPFGDEFYAFTETPVIYKINPSNLNTEGKELTAKHIGIASHTSHPHVMKDGTVINLGVGFSKHGPVYHIICYPSGEAMFDNAHIVATIPCRWKFHPGYMHSFGISKNYFLVVEQPLSVSVCSWIKSQALHQPFASCLKWFEKEKTKFYLIDRRTGLLHSTYQTDALFYLHVINTYEIEGSVIVDICCYKDPAMLDCMYIESMKSMQTNPNYADMFRSRPLRFILPLPETSNSSKIEKLSGDIATTKNIQDKESIYFTKANLRAVFNHLKNVLEEFASWLLFKVDSIRKTATFCNIQPELLCDLGCETPRINYEYHSGSPYRYFYAISADVDAENPGALIKVDVTTKTRKVWSEVNCYPSEPIFVPSPNAKLEDDGVILSAIVWGQQIENKVGLLILCARSWTEIGRCEFETPGPVPKCLHGWYTQDH